VGQRVALRTDGNGIAQRHGKLERGWVDPLDRLGKLLYARACIPLPR
jgi:hypothetical protein